MAVLSVFFGTRNTYNTHNEHIILYLIIKQKKLRKFNFISTAH